LVLSCKVATKLTITVSAGTVGTAVGVVVGVAVGAGVVGVPVVAVAIGVGVLVGVAVGVLVGVLLGVGVVVGVTVGVAVGETKTLPRITFVVLLALTVAVLHPLPLLGSVLVQFAFGVSQTV